MKSNNPNALNSKRPINSDSPPVYRCTRCGKTKSDPKGYFFISKASPLFVGNELYSCICSDCANELFTDISNKLKDTRIGLLVICHYLDVYFSEKLYEDIKGNANFSLGVYLSKLNNVQYKARNFTTYLFEALATNKLIKGSQEIQTDKEEKWSKEDLKNKTRVSHILHYDPFEDENYTNEDRKFMFNLCSDYLVDETTIEDPHKLQGVVELVKTYGQLNKINTQLNREVATNMANESKIKTLSSTKKDLMDLINKFAKENGISASLSNKGQKGSASFAYHIKNLDEIDFTEAKVNLFDIETCESMRQFDEISDANILKQLHLNADELGTMLEDQTKMIFNYKEQMDKLKEENRLLKIKNIEVN